MQEPGWRISRKSDEQPEAAYSLEGTRMEIDELDRGIASMLSERLKLAKGLSVIKESLGMPVEDPQREAKVLSRLSDFTRDKDIERAMHLIYKCVIEQSRQLQELNLTKRH